uniref:Proteasome assembly chaperone 1 n=1 Tax=Anopheles triannulatus TaxID=58253 RepID=A0A2M4AX24_9DIPT
MSLTFGEIVEPSTRAFWDDYDEEEEGDTKPFEPLEWIVFNEQDANTTEQTEIQKTLTAPFRLLIFEGQKVNSFVGTAILKGNKIPVLQLSCGTVCLFHVLGERLVVCVSEEIDPNLFGHITEKLKPWLMAAESVTTISLQPAVMYKGASERELEQVCFIKSLGDAVTDGSVGKLEAPNVLTGVAAGAVGYRKFHLKPAAAYGCYLDSVVIDSVSSEPILRLLKSIGLPCAERYELKFRNSSNLYM